MVSEVDQQTWGFLASYLASEITTLSRVYASNFPGTDENDLRQEMLVQIRSLGFRFDPSKGIASFRTYAYQVLKNACQKYINSERKHKPNLDFASFKGNELVDPVYPHEDLSPYLAQLPLLEARVLRALYGIGRPRVTYRKCASSLGISRRYVCDLHQGGLQHLREALKI